MPACSQCHWDPERRPSATWLIQATGPLPSQNQLGSNGKNGHVYRSIRRRFERDLENQLNAIPRASKFRAAVVTRLYGKSIHGRWQRAYDDANMVGGCKPLIDVLKNFAVIVDDRAEYFRGYYRQQRSPDEVDRYRIELLEFA